MDLPGTGRKSNCLLFAFQCDADLFPLPIHFPVHYRQFLPIVSPTSAAGKHRPVDHPHCWQATHEAHITYNHICIWIYNTVNVHQWLKYVYLQWFLIQTRPPLTVIYHLPLVLHFTMESNFSKRFPFIHPHSTAPPWLTIVTRGILNYNIFSDNSQWWDCSQKMGLIVIEIPLERVRGWDADGGVIR